MNNSYISYLISLVSVAEVKIQCQVRNYRIFINTALVRKCAELVQTYEV